MDKIVDFMSTSEEETRNIAASLAHGFKPGDVLCLYGDLGGGKSVFARALIHRLLKDETIEVPSPTFTLVQTYEAPTLEIWHFDLYRIKEAQDIYELGWDEVLGQALMIIEWPERLGFLKPRNTIDFIFKKDPKDQNTRHIRMKTHET